MWALGAYVVHKGGFFGVERSQHEHKSLDYDAGATSLIPCNKCVIVTY